MDNQSTKQTLQPSWRWRMRTPLTYSSSRQEEQLPEGPPPYPTIVLTFAIEW
uniref:Uncharacterized protein n=1 Tax=Peromyscus maniculatus bairdii TaxID=230844 RepID=A0A8C8U5H3_PERMB